MCFCMCVCLFVCFFFQVLVPGGLGSVLVLVEEQQESLSHNLEGAEVTSCKSHVYSLWTNTHTVQLCSFSFSLVCSISFIFKSKCCNTGRTPTWKVPETLFPIVITAWVTVQEEITLNKPRFVSVAC